MILALTKFHLVVVVLGAEKLMKATKYLYCYEVQVSLGAHPESSGAAE